MNEKFSFEELETLFEAAAALSARAREFYLGDACRGRPELRAEIARLLAAHEAPSPMLEPSTLKITLQKPEIPEQIGPYRLLECLGEGGCGVVYVAEQTQPMRRKVALKVIKPGMDTKSVVARFEAERQALAMMDHPNIARVFDAGTTETGRPYFVMELVRGIRITEHCDQHRLSTEERLELFIKVCQAIQHAHQKGVIHRDIKPSNVLVTLHDGTPVPKVIDFGIAKATAERLTDAAAYTQLHQFIGTPAYMSPEQAEMSGLDMDTRSDIYSLGVLLYELLVGRTPFDGGELLASGVDAMRRIIREKEPLRPSTRFATLQAEESTSTAMRHSTEALKLRRQLKGDLDWIVMKCLAKDRARRYETASGLAADMERFLNHEPISARPPGAAYKAWKTFRRHRVGFTAAALVFLALALGLGGAAWQWRRAETSSRALAREAYWADMTLASQAANEGAWHKVASILDHTRPRAGGPDLRGWEWRYLWGVSRSDEEAHFAQSPNKVVSLAMLPDGHTVAVGEEEGGFYLWDLRRKAKVYELPGQINDFTDPAVPRGQVLATRVAVIPGTSLLAYTSCASPTDAHVQIWDTKKRTLVQSLPLPYELRHLAVSGDGRKLAVNLMNPDTRGFVFDLPSGRMERGFSNYTWNYSGGDALKMSADGKWITLEDGIGFCAVEATDTGQRRFRLPVGDDYLLSTAFSPDGRWLATSGGFSGKTVRLWDLKDGSLNMELHEESGAVWALFFDAASTKLMAGSEIWNIAQRRVQRRLAGAGSISAAAFFANDHKLLTATGSDVSVWDLDRAPPLRKGIVLDAFWFDFLPDDSGLLVVATNGSMGEASAPEFSMKPWSGENDDCASVCVPPNRGVCVVGHGDGTVIVRALKEHNEVRRWKTENAAVGELAYVGNGDFIAGYCADGDLYVWRLETGETHWRVHFSTPGATTGLCVHDGILYQAHGDRAVTCYDLMHRAVFERTLDRAHVDQLSFSPDGSLALASSTRGPKELINGRTFQTLAALDQVDEIGQAAAFWPDNSRVAISGEQVGIVDLADQRELLRVRADYGFGHFVWVSPKGGILVQRADSKLQIGIWRAPSWEEINAAEAGPSPALK